MKRISLYFTLACICIGCINYNLEPSDPGDDPQDEQLLERKYVNTFAYSMMYNYYLWTKEISDCYSTWYTNEEPISKVQAVRYKGSDGNDIDRWTQLTDRYAAFISGVEGTSTTNGLDFILMWKDRSRTVLYAVTTLVYSGSPAFKAGIKRGDVITAVNSKSMTAENYTSLYPEILGGEKVTLSFIDKADITLTPVEMYEDPVILYKTFSAVGGKKLGYLFYNSFTLESCRSLIDVCKHFKDEGVTELILDLRYNGGGFSLTEELLASMLAPQSCISQGSVFQKNVYNSNLQETLGSETHFTTSFDISGVSLSTGGANIGLDKIYAIMGSGSASASEALLTGLMPYMDITLIGKQSYGKYCSGIIYSTEDFYTDIKDRISYSEYQTALKYTDDWGIYLMIGRFADKNGNTPCMPNGFSPDVEADDNPLDGYQIGNPQETLLKTALGLAGYNSKQPSSLTKAVVLPDAVRMEKDFHSSLPGFGMNIIGLSRLQYPESRK